MNFPAFWWCAGQRNPAGVHPGIIPERVGLAYIEAVPITKRGCASLNYDFACLLALIDNCAHLAIAAPLLARLLGFPTRFSQPNSHPL